jgi:hypothetical protein
MRFYAFTLNPKSPSIPSEVFRKHLKKSFRFGSLAAADKTTSLKVIIVPMDGYANQGGAMQPFCLLEKRKCGVSVSVS